MRAPTPAITIVGSGALAFLVVFSLLEFSPSSAAPGAAPPTPAAATATPAIPVAADSIAPKLDASQLAIGVPTAGSEALLRNVQLGDRLDILASLPPPQTGQPLTAILVRGASVLGPASGSDPLLVEVDAADALMLAHVIERGTHLGYVLWPANATSSAVSAPPIDERTAREVLGLVEPTPVSAPTAAAAATTPPPNPTAAPTASPRPGSGFLYQVQPNDTWDSIAAIFGVPVGQLRRWNESDGDADPVPGSLVFIPRDS